MKQKLFSLLLAVALVLSLAACTASPSDSGSNAPSSQAPTADIPDVPDFTDVDTSAFLEGGVLRVGMECAYAPYNWMQMDDSNGAVPISNVPGSYANGYDVMIAKRICEAYGWELEVVSSSWDSLTPAVQAGTMDANIAGQSMTADRMKEVDMAGPYYYATIVCLTTKDSPYASATSIADLAGGTCTAQSGTIWYDSCLPQIPDANILSPADNAPAMIMQLQTGMADFICTDMPTAKGAAAKDDNLVVLDFSGTDGDFQFETEAQRAENVNIGISVKKGNTQLKDAMDAVLSQLTAEDFDAIMDQAIAAQPATDGTDANLFVKLGRDMAQLLRDYYPGYLNGILNTIILAVVATVIGCIIGLVCGILNTIPCAKQDPLPKRILLKVIRAIVRIYVEVFRGTPMVLQAVFIYYGPPSFTNGSVAFRGAEGIWLASIIVVSINTGAYMAESVRGGIISIDPGQTEGARAIGMNHFQTMTSVILPQAIRNIIPQIGNNFIINIKDTSVMFIISFTEFFAFHRYIVGVNNLYFPSAAIEMIGYLTMTLLASAALRLIEKRMDGSDNYELVQVDALTMSAGTYNHPNRTNPFDETSEEKRERIRMGLKNRNGSTRGDR